MSPSAISFIENLTPHMFNVVLKRSAWMQLTQFGVIDVTGDDAASFLHSQLTSDIQNLDVESACFAGYCSPKGRLFASFLTWKTGKTIRLLVSKDVQPAVQQRLSMFILRSNAKLINIGSQLTVVGFVGDVRTALLHVFDTLPNGVHVKVNSSAGTLIRVSNSVGQQRYLWVGPKTEVEAHLVRFTAITQVSPALWDWLDIHAGEPRITQPVVEQLVPQMINYDVLGGINFRKGCYPGQEVVARSQYRGTIKRRMILANVAAPLNLARPGAELFSSNDSLSQPCGIIVNSAVAPKGDIDMLVAIKLAALENGTVHLGTADEFVLTFLPLPYTLPTKG